MSDDTSRRDFLRWLGISSGAIILPSVGCDAGAETPVNDAGNDSSDAANSGDVGGSSCELTGEDVRGPFFEEGAPERTMLATSDEPGQRMVVEGTIYEPDCETPVQGAILDVWQADEEGDYHGGQEDDYRLRAQMVSDEQGHYRFETIKPGNYPMGGDQIRPAHIHFTVTKPGFSPLTTQMYFAGDPHLGADDPCGPCNSGDSTLIVEFEDVDGQQQGVFDIVLEKS